MAVVYSKNRNEYRVYYGGQKKTFYSLNKYGDYAIILAELAMKEKKRVVNYIIENDDHAIVKIYSQTHGYFDILIDKDDINKVKDTPWYISPKGRTFYAENNQLGGMHRVIMDSSKIEIIDHVDKNGLNNRKLNLRNTDKSGNARNINPKSNNKTGVLGVEYDGRRFIATARDLKGNKRRKHFGTKKYGYDAAFQLAIQQRKEYEKLYYSVKD